MKKKIERIEGRVLFYFDKELYDTKIRSYGTIIGLASCIADMLKKKKYPVTIEYLKAFINVSKRVESTKKEKVYAGGIPTDVFTEYESKEVFDLPDGVEDKLKAELLKGFDNLSAAVRAPLEKEIMEGLEQLKADCYTKKVWHLRKDEDILKSFDLDYLQLGANDSPEFVSDFIQKIKNSCAVCAENPKAENLYVLIMELEEKINEVAELCKNPSLLLDMFQYVNGEYQLPMNFNFNSL